MARKVGRIPFLQSRPFMNTGLLVTVDLSGWRTKVMEEMAAKDDDVEMEVGEVIQVLPPCCVITSWRQCSS